jgi:hypothetical protein
MRVREKLASGSVGVAANTDGEGRPQATRQIVAHSVDEEQLAPGIDVDVARPPETCTIRSARPWMTSTGERTERSDTERFGCVRIARIRRRTPGGLRPRS